MMRYQIAFVQMSGGGIPAPIRSNGSWKARHGEALGPSGENFESR